MNRRARPAPVKKERTPQSHLVEFFITEDGTILLANAGSGTLSLIDAVSGQQNSPSRFYCG